MMRYEFVRAMAESFEYISNLESACYHYLYNADSTARQAYHRYLYDHFCSQLTSAQPKINADHLDRIVNAALNECTHPVQGDGYAWTDKDRQLATSISKATWWRHGYGRLYLTVIDDVRRMSDRVECLTDWQIADYYRPTPPVERLPLDKMKPFLIY